MADDDDDAEPTSAPLTTERIVGAAITLADHDGLSAVSMRKVADALGSGVMSLYRHVATKEALITEMVDVVNRHYAYPDAPEADWREKLRILSRTDWAMYRAHPWMIEASTQPVASPAMAANMDWALAAIDELDLPIDAATSVVLTVATYVIGIARVAASTPAGGDMGRTWWATVSTVPLGDLTHLNALVAAVPDMDAEVLMSDGLELILDGIAARAAG